MLRPQTPLFFVHAIGLRKKNNLSSNSVTNALTKTSVGHVTDADKCFAITAWQDKQIAAMPIRNK